MDYNHYMAKTPTPLDRDAIRKRIADEREGIAPGVNFGDTPDLAPPIPDITELGLPLAIRKKLTELSANHAELGVIERQAKKDRDKLSAAIKELLAEHVPDDVPSFMAGEVRVSRYTQNRPSFDKDAMRVGLLNQGVKPAIIATAMEGATTVKLVTTLRISLPGEREDA